jgi:hypothetical protein
MKEYKRVLTFFMKLTGGKKKWMNTYIKKLVCIIWERAWMKPSQSH